MIRTVILFIAAGLLAATVPLVAHHSEAAQFDTTKPVKVTGTVKKIEWMNPHVWFYVDVKDDKGNITTWGFAGLPPGMLVRKGFTKDTLKIGETVSVQGFRAKDGSNNASGFSLTFSDGRQVFPGALEVGAVPKP
jgi:DNA/RNA endonuclease YhcR with UshA esterase domain